MTDFLVLGDVFPGSPQVFVDVFVIVICTVVWLSDPGTARPSGVVLEQRRPC